MIYTQMTVKAMCLAYRAHDGQVDKGGVPYIFHPIHVAEQMTNELDTAAALLHDVVEDTPVTLEDLRREGFPEALVEAVAVMTRDMSVPYADYIARVKGNAIARRVKLADLRHNMDTSRLPVVDEEALMHVRRYKKAVEVLEAAEAVPA